MSDIVSMDVALQDLLEILGCGVNGGAPSAELTGRYAESGETLEMLYRISRAHFVDALTGTVLRQAGVMLPDKWEQGIAKAVRKVMLFDAERKVILDFLERENIWYLPLKGIIMKEYYPSIGMRQMSDNDILFDETRADDVRDYMVSRGYGVESFGVGNHDVYEKKPVYNFEMHRALYGSMHESGWEDYYRNIKSRLVQDDGCSCGFHMTPEDFYVYIVSHGYKHYKGSGTGVRTLLDFYVFLRRHARKLDFKYIENECGKLGIARYEEQSRKLCMKVFGTHEALSDDEKEMLQYYLTSGVYGTTERMVENRMKRYGGGDRRVSKLTYVLRRVFPGEEVYKYYPLVDRHRWLLPGLWIWRPIRLIFNRERRHRVRSEAEAVRKI